MVELRLIGTDEVSILCRTGLIDDSGRSEVCLYYIGRLRKSCGI